MRALWVTAWAIIGLGYLVGLCSVITGILIGFDRLTGAAIVLMVAALVGNIALVWWTDDHTWIKMPKAERRELQARERRLQLEKEIAALEKENGTCE